MNDKIFNLIVKKIREYLNCERHPVACEAITADTVVEDLPWTPARFRKCNKAISQELSLDVVFSGSIGELTKTLDIQYSNKFFSQIWSPMTDTYSYTGWNLVEEINALDPDKVLDVGCGYNQFKQRIKNLTGIDPYNNQADYQVDILEFVDDPETYDAIIALGSINFNSKSDINDRISTCVELLKPGGRMFFRVNPGVDHEHGPWIRIFPWKFADVQYFAKQHNLTIETFKKDNNNRLYFVYVKDQNAT